VPQFADVRAVVAIVGSPIVTHEMIDLAAGSAQLWQVFGTGLDHTDVPYIASKGMRVANCPGTASAIALAECAFMHMLMLSKQYLEARANLDDGHLYSPVTSELEGQKLALLGFGASARELATRAKSFGMEILAIDVLEISDADASKYGVTFSGTPDDIDEVLTQADYVSLHLHLQEDTHHVLDRRRRALLKPTAFVINVARGELIDEEALAQALLQKRIAGAGLDVYAQEPPDPSAPLFGLPNVTATPHNAGGTDGTARRRAAMVAENLDRLEADRDLLYVVG
jgi:D-3-phosphoglycerate dehydrogenase